MKPGGGTLAAHERRACGMLQPSPTPGPLDGFQPLGVCEPPLRRT